MSDKKQLLIKVYLAELEDLLLDLEDMKQGLKVRRSNSEITEYVFMENTALLQSEILSLKILLKDILARHLESLSPFEEAVGALRALLVQETQDYQFPKVVLALAQRRLERVLRFLREDF